MVSPPALTIASGPLFPYGREWSAHSTITHDYDAADTLVVSDPAQLRRSATTSRSNHRAPPGTAASASELGGLLDMPKGTVGHHLKVLERAGLVHVVRTRRVRAVTEKYYGRVARLFLYKSGDESNDELVHGVGAMSLRVAAAEVAAAPEVAMHALLRVRLSPLQPAFRRRLTSSPTTCGRPRRPTASPGVSRPPSTSRPIADAPAGRTLAAPRFRNLWTAETISVFGSQFTGLALPLVAVLLLDASPFAVSALVVIEFLPFVLFAIPAGVWVDRMKRKPILVIGDLGRAALLASIPVAYAFDALTLGHLYVVGFLVGVCTVFFDVAYQSYLPSLVDRAQLVEGNSKLEISRSASQLAGPGSAGVVISAVGAPVAMLLDAISFFVSALFLFSIRKTESLPERAEHEARPSMLADAREGSASCSATATCVDLDLHRLARTSSGAWAARSSSSTRCASWRCRAAALGLAFSLGNARAAVRRVHDEQDLRPPRRRPDDPLGSGRLLGLDVPGSARDEEQPRSVPRRLGRRRRLRSGRLQHHADQLPASDLPRAHAGPDERGHPLHRLGHDALGALLGGALGTWFGLRPASGWRRWGPWSRSSRSRFSPVPRLARVPDPVDEPLPSEAEAAGGLVPVAAGPAARRLSVTRRLALRRPGSPAAAGVAATWSSFGRQRPPGQNARAGRLRPGRSGQAAARPPARPRLGSGGRLDARAPGRARRAGGTRAGSPSCGWRRPQLLPRPPRRPLGRVRRPRGDSGGAGPPPAPIRTGSRSAASRWAASARSTLARLHPGRFCAVGGHSPAIWRTGGETPAGAFDDAEDFARHDLFGGPYTGARRLDRRRPGRPVPRRGEDVRGAAAPARARRDAADLGGGHDRDYWKQHLADTSRFYADALARCR